jgi:hypothetical protein
MSASPARRGHSILAGPSALDQSSSASDTDTARSTDLPAGDDADPADADPADADAGDADAGDADAGDGDGDDVDAGDGDGDDVDGDDGRARGRRRTNRLGCWSAGGS